MIVLLVLSIVLWIITGIIYISSADSIDERDTCIIQLLVAVNLCDGKRDDTEISATQSFINSTPLCGNYIFSFFKDELKRTIVKFLGYDPSGIPLFVLIRKNNNGLVSRQYVSDLSTKAISKVFHKYTERMEFMDALFKVAYSQDGVSDVEVDLLREVAHYLCIKSWDLTGFLYKYEYMMDEQQKKRKEEERNRTEKDKGSEEGRDERQKAHETRFKNVTNTRTKEALQLLEITEKADEQEIKSAYRRLAKKYHPDTLPANVSEEEKEEAAARFRSIHEAYEFLLSMEMVRAK